VKRKKMKTIFTKIAPLRMAIIPRVKNAVLKWIDYAEKMILNGLKKEKNKIQNFIKKTEKRLKKENKNGFPLIKAKKVIGTQLKNIGKNFLKNMQLTMLYIMQLKMDNYSDRIDVNYVIIKEKLKPITVPMIMIKELPSYGFANIVMKS